MDSYLKGAPILTAQRPGPAAVKFIRTLCGLAGHKREAPIFSNFFVARLGVID